MSAAAGRRPGVIIDLTAAQRPGYRGRGVARWAVEVTRALVEGHAGLVRSVRLDARMPHPDGAEDLVGSGLVTTGPPETTGVYHLMGPFDLDATLGELWPLTRAGMSMVATVYDLIPEVMAGVYLGDPGFRRRYRARRNLVRAADAVVTLSASSAGDVVQRLGVDARRVSVVGAAASPPFGPPTSVATARTAARRALPGIGERWIAYNGAVEPRKNLDRLVEAFAALPPGTRAGYQLVVVCAMNALQRNHYEVLARKLGIGEQLVLAGYLTDVELAALYQGAELAVFPSLYEGYGLPVAEALACGAPVLASGNSAPAELVHPEATFDPTSVQAITASLGRGLEDSAWRERLRSWAAKPQPTWAEVAGRVAEVYRRLLARLAGARAAPSTALTAPLLGAPAALAAPLAAALTAPFGALTARLPRVALVTPWPPQRTGVADYSRRLVDALQGKVRVDLVVDGDDPPDAGDLAVSTRPWLLAKTALAAGGYDAVVVTLGNSEYHAGALRLLRRGAPAARNSTLKPIVLAHDVNLTGLYRHGTARGAVPEGFHAALTAMYPGWALPVEDGWLPPALAEELGILMAREAIAASSAFLATSEHAAALARLDAAPEDTERVGVWPYCYPATVPRPERSGEEGLIASFGMVNAVKRPEVLLEALATVAGERPAARLAFVGPVAGEEEERLRSQAAGLGIGERVTFAGYSDQREYEAWLRRSSVAVQLRSRSNGETSGAIADCLTHGLATVVSDIGPQRELPASVTRVSPGAGATEVAATIGALLDDGALRARLGREAQAWAAGRGFDRAADFLVELIG